MLLREGIYESVGWLNARDKMLSAKTLVIFRSVSQRSMLFLSASKCYSRRSYIQFISNVYVASQWQLKNRAAFLLLEKGIKGHKARNWFMRSIKGFFLEFFYKQQTAYISSIFLK